LISVKELLHLAHPLCKTNC